MQPDPEYPSRPVRGCYSKARKTGRTADMAGDLAAVKNPDGTLLVDERERAEYRAGHVPGAGSMSRGTPEVVI